MFKESYNVVVKGITEIACDELGEFAGEGITKLIFNSNSKPEENYKEIVYEESLENNLINLKNQKMKNILKLKEMIIINMLLQ